MENEKNAFMVTHEIFGEMLKKLLEKLKSQGVVKDFVINTRDRMISININEEADIPEGVDDLIQKGIFYNTKNILTDLGYPDANEKVIMLPIYSVQEKENGLIVNY